MCYCFISDTTFSDKRQVFGTYFHGAFCVILCNINVVLTFIFTSICVLFWESVEYTLFMFTSSNWRSQPHCALAAYNVIYCYRTIVQVQYVLMTWKNSASLVRPQLSLFLTLQTFLHSDVIDFPTTATAVPWVEQQQ